MDIKISDAISHDTIIRATLEYGYCAKVAISLTLSRSTDLAWSIDETEDSNRNFSVITFHGNYQSQIWHFVLKLSEIPKVAAINLLQLFQNLMEELNE